MIFKFVNYTYGHEFGDQVLIRIAQVLEEECPQQGYVCRYEKVHEFLFNFSTCDFQKGTTVHGIRGPAQRLTKENIMNQIV